MAQSKCDAIASQGVANQRQRYAQRSFATQWPSVVGHSNVRARHGRQPRRAKQRKGVAVPDNARQRQSEIFLDEAMAYLRRTGLGRCEAGQRGAEQRHYEAGLNNAVAERSCTKQWRGNVSHRRSQQKRGGARRVSAAYSNCRDELSTNRRGRGTATRSKSRQVQGEVYLRLFVQRQCAATRGSTRPDNG